jgi:hypothetical protein
MVLQKMSLHDRPQRLPRVQVRDSQPVLEQAITGWISRDRSERHSRPNREVLVSRPNESIRPEVAARMRMQIRCAHDVEIGCCLVYGVTDRRV